jgi:uncharacterized protein YndB with AHSA1/START domain
LALRFNATFSLATGTGALVFDERLTTMLDLPRVVFAVLGGGLVGYGLLLGGLSLARRVASPWTVLVTAMDVAWVLGSIALVALHAMPAMWVVLATSAVVAACAVLQLVGLRRAVFDDGGGHFELAREVNAPAERSWSVVSDVASYAEFAGTLHKSEIVSGEGVGLVRRCEDTNGVCWLETCTRWEPGKAYAFEVDTTGPGYPLPLSTMRGDFEVDRVSDARSTIRVRFTFSARGGAWTELLLSLIFAASGDRLVGAILRRWAARIEQPKAKLGSAGSARVAS